ncbi:FtsK/SpoIIIE domain-containing protein, partial [Breznakiellaceae bacterium SP9]
MPTAFSNGDTIRLPLTVSMGEPLHLLVEYDSNQKTKVMAGIQSIILKLLRFMPAFSFNLTYIDPNDRGTNLGLLQKLAGSSADIFKKTYASKEDITRRLKELEGFVDQTSAQLAGVENVYLYNADAANETKIPYQFIVINDYPDHFDNYADESLQILIKNSEKCGISFIFTSSEQQEDLPAKIKIAVESNYSTVHLDGRSYDFDFDKVIQHCDAFIETVKTVYNEGIKVDNSFAAFPELNDQDKYMKKESTESVIIPFAVDSFKHLVSLELGGPLSAHALLSGITGSGKSTTLHMLISSIVMNYHPDDVELWLVDYKEIEFAEYIECLPPHVRLLGLERRPEFIFSLLDKIDEVFQGRMKLFKSEGVKDITE